MKVTRLNIGFVLVVCGMLSVACEDMLSERPLDFTEPQNLYQNRAQCEAAVNGCYRPLTSVFQAGLMRMVEGTTDLAFRDSDDDNDVLGISPANPGNGAAIWNNCYKGIMYCNEVMEGLLSTPVTRGIGSLKGETVFLRALYYYVLTSTFGDVPFYKDNVKDAETLEKVSRIPRMDAEATRDSLMEELKFYADSVPVIAPTAPRDRISRQALWMLIGKLAMWNKDYATAREYLEQIRLLYGELSEYSLEDTWFRNKNTPESIFEVQFAWSATGLKKTTQVACFMTPPRSGSKYDGVEIPELGAKASIYNAIRPSLYFISLYDKLMFDLPDDLYGEDPRREMILATRYNGQGFSQPMRGGKPWMGPKFWCPGMDNISDGNNQKVFRFADALLMLAECANELGDSQTALECLREVRARAQYVTFFNRKDQELLRQEIRDERARELMGEYGRKWDLVRWGIYYEQMKNTVAVENEKIARHLRPYHEYYPIPDTEVVRSGGALTNEAYNSQQ